MTSNKNTLKSQVLAASFTKLLFGVLFLVGSIYTHTDFLVKLGDMCNGSIYCVFDFMSGFLLAGVGFFFISVIIDGTIAGRQGTCGLIMNISGSILLFASIAAELENGRLGLLNLQAVPNLLGGVWAASGILTSIGYASLAWTQKFQGCFVVIAYLLALVGSILLALAGVMRTDDVIDNMEDVVQYFDTLAGKVDDSY